MARRNLPGYLKHKSTRQAFCVINGRFFYLGKYGSKSSREEYERIIAEYLANGKKLPPLRNRNEILIEELAVKYLEYAEGYYVKDGRVTETFGHSKDYERNPENSVAMIHIAMTARMLRYLQNRKLTL